MSAPGLTAPIRALVGRHLGGRWEVGEVVDALFRQILLRPADPPSRRFYARALARGGDLGAVVRALHTSVEARENSWRAPLAAALGPALRAGGPGLYVA